MSDDEKTDSLKEAARRYWLEGCNIVLLKGKEPLHKWSQWQNERQDELDFERLPWNEADGFAVICGQQLHNELYIGAIDFDVKNLPSEVVEKGRKALKFLPTTQREQTPSGGEHWIYLCRVMPKTVSVYHNICGLELLGEGKLCIVAPSLGYRKLNDNPPTEVEDLEALFYQALEKADVKVEKPKVFWFDNEEFSKKPYRGKDPPCISALLKGVKEGLRNEAGIRLASYFINFKQYSPKTVREDILKSWNRLNSPQLHWKELDGIVKSAIEHGYVYGCTDPILKSFCMRDTCPLAPKQLAKLLTPEEKERAEKLLADPKLLDYVVQYGRHRLIGEDNVLLTNFVVLCSGQTKYPISGVLTGFSGSGKNESVRAIKPLIPPEWLFEFTTSTPEAVKYIPEDFSGTLVIYEIAGLESKTGSLGLRAVGEGESIETIFPIRDEETGEMKLGRHKTNAKNFLTTESDIDINPDLYRRVLRLSMNHSDDLTRRVLAKKLRDAMLPEKLRKKLASLNLNGFPQIKENNIPYSEQDFQNALRLIDWNVEVILFPPSSLLKLEKLAAKKEQRVALRSQIERILNFIRVLAIIHQRQRIIVEDVEDGSKFVVANYLDFEIAMKTLYPSIIETVSRLDKRLREALSLIEENPDEVWDKHKLADKLAVQSATAAKYLKSLSALGYLREIQTTRPYTYEFIHGEKEAKQLGLFENLNEYKLFYEKQLDLFLNGIFSPCKFLRIGGVVEKYTDMHKNVHECTEISNPPSLTQESKGEEVRVKEAAGSVKKYEQKQLCDSERPSKKEAKSEEKPKEDISMFECKLCKNMGKNVYFITQADLDNHLKTFHRVKADG